MPDTETAFDPRTWIRELTAPELYLGSQLAACPIRPLSAQAAAGMVEVPFTQTMRHLTSLVAAGTVKESPDGYRAMNPTNPAEYEPSCVRQLGLWLLHSGSEALSRIGMNSSYWQLQQAATPLELPAFCGFADAYRWLREQRPNMLTILKAAGTGPEPFVWQLAWVVGVICAQDNDIADWIEAINLGIVSAEACRDTTGMAAMVEYLAMAHSQQGRTKAAAGFQRQAFLLRAESGDKHGLMRTFNARGLIARRERRYEEALEAFAQAEALATSLADPEWEVLTRSNAASARAESGDIADVEQALMEKAAYFADHAAPLYKVGATLDLSSLLRGQGNHHDALHLGQMALETALDLGIALLIAPAMRVVAMATARLGDGEGALQLLREAARIYYLQLGDLQRGAVTLDEAVDVLREMSRADEADALARYAADLRSRLVHDDEQAEPEG